MPKTKSPIKTTSNYVGQMYKQNPNQGYGADISVKTIIAPRQIDPRWSSVADTGEFHGQIRLGTGRNYNIVCGFTNNRHFFVLVLDTGRGALFRSGELTSDVEAGAALNLELPDAANMSDFINCQLAGGLEPTAYVGEYQRQHCI